MPSTPPADALAAASRFSRYLQRLLHARPVLAEDTSTHLDAPVDRATLEAWLVEEPVTEDNLKPVLRRFK